MDKATRLIPSAKEVHARIRAELAEEARTAATVSTIAPVDFSQRTRNLLRPARLDEVTGQVRLRGLLRRLIDAAQQQGEPLDHLLLVGPSGVGKSTVAHIVANEMGVRVFQVEAPVSHETLLDLRAAMADRDILFIDEIHQQAIMERRGRTTNTQPEVLFAVMEDRTIVSGSAVLPFPEITLIGATTDEGMLPDPFINRFPIRPAFEPYTILDLAAIADANADTYGVQIMAEACLTFAYASRGVPRQINNYVKLARRLDANLIDETLALEVLDLSSVTEDGLTADMQRLLVFMLSYCEQHTAEGDVVYRAGLSTIATGIGKSRDVKAITLRVEPYLISQGYLQVGHGGRRLTPNGVARAYELLLGGGTG
jgi:Holliday junction DNA helicase RuvB